MDRAVSILATGEEGATTLGSHPPASERRVRLRQALINYGYSRFPVQVENAIQLENVLTQSLELMWERATILRA